MTNVAEGQRADGPLVLALDQGTTSSRAILFGRDGTVRGMAQRPLAVTYPHPGWVNQDARDIRDDTLAVAREAMASAGIGAADIAAIGIANQRETTILWDRRTGEPVAPAIVWQSRQSASVVEALEGRGMSAAVQDRTGLVPDSYFSATKVAWMLDADPELRRRAASVEIAFGTVDSWLLWTLTGGTHHITDVTNASRTMVFDIHDLAWSDELLGDLAIPAAILPGVVPSCGVVAQTDPDLFGAPIPIAGIAGDQQAALFGQACFRPGEAKNTYGTGSFVLMQTGPSPSTSAHRLLTTVAWGLPDRTDYALEGAIFATGAAVQWLRDGLGIIREAADIEGLAASVADSGGVAFVPALTGLGAPVWDAGARGTITGITRGTTAGHLARATLEAIALQTRDVIVAMEADSGITLAELRVDGGAAANDLLMQIQADVLGVPVIRPATTETTALGASYLAGLATGVWQGQDEVRDRWREDRRFEPAMAASDRDAMVETWRDAVGRSRSRDS
ncbi:MAG: Glycerol kinase [uncultured Thermomicrobiales bacterium]|uniref:Glycerol kinase n=1 Tax=uncultured Thermomicrobiales bacterium TaxID=1645740 RepID=A0A6J4V3E3_9BACT|nr:MAG: Glycerol kinase [uncultured Thermomicrobiales bacterium]